MLNNFLIYNSLFNSDDYSKINLMFEESLV